MQVPSFIHHPTEVPVKMVVSENQFPLPCINEKSSTGVYIHTETRYIVNTCVEVEINVQTPAFFAKGYVCCSEPLKDGIGFETGVVFDCPDTAFAVRMIEQVCYIEQYRQQVSLTEGRELSIDLAAAEWITQHAANFPELNTI
ncbi:MAG: hypothetical protein OFPII_07330 [Osedax symbiont Rs1]|nr:MAG: hypothetical protein OFPII_07330 [Osedax symbiont Rs1]